MKRRGGGGFEAFSSSTREEQSRGAAVCLCFLSSPGFAGLD
jgi:hypothetical protein